jgi:hypothetical protein
MRGKGDRRRLTTVVYDAPTRPTNFQIQIIQHFAFVRSRRDLKEKNYRDGSRYCFCSKGAGSPTVSGVPAFAAVPSIVSIPTVACVPAVAGAHADILSYILLMRHI